MEFKCAPSALMKISCATHAAHENSLDSMSHFGALVCIVEFHLAGCGSQRGPSLALGGLGGLLKNEEDSMTHLVRVLIPECPLRDFHGSPLIFKCWNSPLKRTSLARLAHNKIL